MKNSHGAGDDGQDVAVVGLSLRLPGARTPDEFWDHLAAGRSLISEVPERRWRKEDHLGHPRREFNKTNSVWGGFVDDADCFDAEFFQISPREARSMDPQQRMALELGWHALEDAGYRADRLAGSRTGVFMGVCHWDYAELIEQQVDEIDAYYPTGAAYAIIANRVSHHFDFHGPSVVNDTACSSSLVAVQQAVQALQSGDCDAALAGGVNLTWSPRHFIAFAKAGMLSPDGLCRAFDAKANGYVRGEGGGMVMLKRAEDARRDGDAVYAVIKGIGSNHGGRTSSLTVTNPAAQADLITGIYRRSGIDAHSVSYIETHGPGTPVGDPIEISGLKRAFAELDEDGAEREREHRCGVGSVKTNIGHLEGAAGVAGMLKVILAMRHAQLPATVNFSELNPLIDLDGSPLYVVDRLSDWETDEDAPLRAGVSSFGFGGTNAHVVLEAGTPVAAHAPERSGEQWLPVSAENEERLLELCGGLASWARTHIDLGDVPDLADIAHTLREGRVPMRERVVFRAGDIGEWADRLEAFVDGGKPPEGCLRGRADGATGDGLDAEDLAELATRWLEKGSLEKFAAAWTKGMPLDWAQWPEAGRRVHLPGYVFARTRHWFEPTAQQARNAVETTAPQEPESTTPPVLGAQEAEGDGWTFPLHFDAGQGFVRDHSVNGSLVVPGVVALDLVTTAAGRPDVARARAGAAPRLRNVVWIRPLLVRDAPLTPRLRLTAVGEGYDYAIVDGEGAAYTSGRVEYTEAVPEAIDLAELADRHPVRVDTDAGYAALRASGIEHGPALRALHTVHSGADGVLAQVRLPGEAPADLTVQPAILDSALVAALALGADEGGWRTPATPAVPFALDGLTVHGATTATMWAWLRPTENAGTGRTALDLDLIDTTGRLCVRLTGYTSRELPTAQAAGQRREGELLEVTRVWEPVPVPAVSTPDAPVTVLNAVLDQELAETSATRLGMEVEHVTAPKDVNDADAMKGLFESSYLWVRRLLGRARRVILILRGSPDSPVHEPIAALLKTAHQEDPSFQGKVVLLEDGHPRDAERFERVLRLEAGAEEDTEVAYTDEGRRLRHETVEVAETGTGTSLLREEGVYWITGGSGGIGLVLAEWLCRNHGATVIVSGRSPQSPDVEVLRGRLSRGTVTYRPTDVTDADGVGATVDAIRADHGRLDGVFHAAGVLDDGFIASKPLEGTAAVLAPKVDGVTHIDAATSEIGLDFLLLFGSVAGAFGNAAQADYAAANAFLDAFAVHREETGGVTRVVDWPLWEDGGMRMDEASLAYLRKRTGTVPLPSDVGLGVLERALRTDSPVRRVALFGEEPKLRVYAGLERPEEPAPAPTPRREHHGAPVLGEEELTARTQDFLREQFAQVTLQDPEQIQVEEKLETYGIDSISIVDLTSKLEDTFGSLPKTLFFEYVDLQGVAEYFVTEHRDRLLDLFAPAESAADAQDAQAAPPPDPRPAPAAAPAALGPVTPATPESPATPATPASDVETAVTTSVPRPVAGEPFGERAPARGDVAVVGMAGRYPGADTLEEFWELLSEGRHGFETVPESRWRHSDLYFDERDVQGKTVVRTGTFLRDVEAFDPRYFNISQRDAELLAPEVRLFLQSGVTALEDAGYSRETLRRRYDSDVGVLVSSMNNSYSLYGFQNMLMRGAPTSGSEIGVMANMLSYHYGFTGPSMFLDTMCSSSSACVHQALRLLRDGECRMVVVGGINLMLHPFDLIATSQAHFTTKSADVVRSYGLGADGTILGEGVGTLVLKPLEEAVADGDHVYGVIKGSGMTNAGVRNGFTVPNPRQQGRAIEKALDDASVNARTISYLEGHGSATSLGDPIEIKGASVAFGRDTDDLGYCAIGSVKSNVAHLLSGAGMVGLTKVLLQLRHRTLAPSLHSETLSPAIDFEKTPFVVQRERADWRRPVIDGETVPRRAGVTSIGAGGVNVHLIVEEHDGRIVAAPESGLPRLVVLSAMTPQTLGTVLRDTARFVRETGVGLDALAYATQTGKNELPCRLAFVADDIAEARNLLDDLAGREWTADTSALPEGVGFTPSTLRQRRSVDAAGLDQALTENRLSDLARYWVEGAAVDWDRLWPLGHRPAKVALPAYPFEKVRCWYPEFEDAPSVSAPLSLSGRAHPWVGTNRSDVHGVRYALEPRGDDLLDYVYSVGRKRRFVTVALLDGALAFVRLAGIEGPLSLRNPRWARLPAPADQVCALEWRLGTDASGEPRAELWHVDEGTLRFTTDVVVSAAPLSAAALPPEWTEGPTSLDRDAFRARLDEMGVDPRPYSTVVDGVALIDGHRLLVRIAEPAMCQDPHKRNVHIPAWVLAGLIQGVQHATGLAEVSMARADSVAGHQWERARTIVLERTSDTTFRALFHDAAGHALGLIERAEFTADALAPSLPSEPGRGPVPLSTAMVAASDGTAASGTVRGATEPVVTGPVVVTDTGSRIEAGSRSETDAATAGEEGAVDRARLVTLLRETVADLLKFDVAEIDTDTDFHAFGFESIALAGLAEELGGTLGVDLSPAVFFECPNIRTLTEYLEERHGDRLRLPGAEGGAAPTPGVVGAATGAEISSAPVGALPTPAAGPLPDPSTPTVAAAASSEDHVGRASGEGTEPDSTDAIAIVGVAGRFPGAEDTDQLWRRLRSGDDLIDAFPGDRFDGPYADVVAGADFPKFAGRIADVDRFDAEFFHLSRLEAELMDPQHRLALETVWAALENGAYAPGRLPENTGVYFGVSGHDYHQLLNASGVAPDGFTATGNAHSMLANRISYVLDVHGPSEPIDTACSSSLIAVHRAVESIRAGRCSMAIAGGVNLLLSVDTFAATQMAGMLSPDGRCKTFSAEADGYVRSEGVAVVLLKPLAQALRDGDAVWGVVRGSAENHGGRAGSLTAPNGNAQAELIQDAMRETDPDSVGYIEAHGTGTQLGDPVEVNAIDKAYRSLRAARGTTRVPDQPVLLGSVKSNMGHLEAAAGLAGVLKVLLAMRHRELPPSLHCERLNPGLPLADGGLEVVREVRHWEPRVDAEGRAWPLRAGVSSFGFGGVNAHLVLEEPPAPAVRAGGAAGPQAVVLSARDTERLRASAEALRDALRVAREEGRAPDPADLAFTLQVGRDPMEERLGFVAANVEEVIDVLERFLRGDRPDGWSRGSLSRSRGTGVRRGREQDPRVASALREGRIDEVTSLWCAGTFVDWRAAHTPGERRVVRLPGYPFARDRYWVPAADRPTDPAPPTAHGPAVDTDAYTEVLDAVLEGRAEPDQLGRP
ncbi:SDR family NAD(P)-dependent oxidoreductase [Nocardiopsis sp. MG754419]|uniref:SDR family NAD(P)-dependent oxidoreductase n=1 Tax=Nocardiopsis sp. MG754419 TaxID=2259865 RepID=UPI001BA9912E|nr:SDR family NAD(P)-dependent oxidoreductase [Nocardiopsis sp. MG754419]MBR8740351.1 hypothetical protein [Nocardiopsis sp. MG754419]